MKTILEFLLSKKRNKINDKDAKWYVFMPSDAVYNELLTKHKKELVRQYRSSFDYWIMTGDEILDILNKFDEDTLDKIYLRFFEVPEQYYENIDEFITLFKSGKVNPFIDLKSLGSYRDL